VSRPTLIIPALNEAASIGRTLAEVSAAAPGIPTLVVDDGSSDETSAVARAAGAW
jgi:glycosyltransferase involved in cell wall biosynthesis